MEFLGTLFGIAIVAGFLYIFIGPFVKIGIESAQERRRKRKIDQAQNLKRQYPDAYKEWFGNDYYFSNMSDYELDRRVSKSSYEWQSKQRSIEEQRERERRERERKLEQERKERERKEYRRNQANEICKRFPNAIKKRLGVSTVYSEESVEKVLGFSVRELQLEETEILDEIRRRQAEIDAKYRTIESKYPHGLAYVIKMREARRNVDEIYSRFEKRSLERGASINNDKRNLIAIPEEVFQKYESISLEYTFNEEWYKKQKEFNDKVLKVKRDDFKHWGNYSYDIPYEGIDDVGRSKIYFFPICHIFTDCFCLSDEVEYTYYPSYKDDRRYIGLFKLCQASYNADVYSKIFDFIERIAGPKSVIIPDSGFGQLWNEVENYHFGDIKRRLQEKGIPAHSCCGSDASYAVDNPTIIVLELVSNNARLKDICKKAFLQNREKQPQIVYLTLDKEYDKEELQALNKRKEKEINDAAEKERREREARERREREEAERRAREAREAEERRKRDEAARKAREKQQRLYSISHTQKANAAAFKSHLISNGVRYFYHFTDRRNLDSIKKQGGLYSWRYCEDHGITIPYPGGDGTSRSLDSYHGLSDYVRLSFCTDHPMKWVLEQKGYNMVLLRVRIDVACLEGTLFSDINATDSNHRHGGTLDDLKRVNIQATQENYVSKTSPIFKQHQAEVMVKTFIPLEYIEMPSTTQQNYYVDDSLPF